MDLFFLTINAAEDAVDDVIRMEVTGEMRIEIEKIETDYGIAMGVKADLNH